jgi:hypothetical protein
VLDSSFFGFDTRLATAFKSSACGFVADLFAGFGISMLATRLTGLGISMIVSRLAGFGTSTVATGLAGFGGATVATRVTGRGNGMTSDCLVGDDAMSGPTAPANGFVAGTFQPFQVVCAKVEPSNCSIGADGDGPAFIPSRETGPTFVDAAVSKPPALEPATPEARPRSSQAS